MVGVEWQMSSATITFSQIKTKKSENFYRYTPYDHIPYLYIYTPYGYGFKNQTGMVASSQLCGGQKEHVVSDV